MDIENARQDIISKLRMVYDPEISVNIYDLGLIYDIDLSNMPVVNIRMTLTSAWCPSADDILRDVKRLTSEVHGVSDVEIKIVWDPPWGPHMMSEEAQMELNMMQDMHNDSRSWGPPW